MLLELDDFPAIQNLYKEAIKNMDEAIINIDQVQLILACSKWSSKTRIAFEDLIILCVKYQDKLIEFLEENEVNAKKFIKDVDDFMRNDKTLNKLD